MPNKIKNYLSALFGFLLLGQSAYSQNATIQIALKDSILTDSSNCPIVIVVTNKGFPKYWVQDTNYIKTRVDDDDIHSMPTYLERKQDGKYMDYNGRRRFIASRSGMDSCFWKCCNCIILKKGKELRFKIALLKNTHLVAGEYRMQVSLIPPKGDCTICEEGREIWSNVVYFTVLKD